MKKLFLLPILFIFELSCLFYLKDPEVINNNCYINPEYASGNINSSTLVFYFYKPKCVELYSWSNMDDALKLIIADTTIKSKIQCYLEFTRQCFPYYLDLYSVFKYVNYDYSLQLQKLKDTELNINENQSFKLLIPQAGQNLTHDKIHADFVLIIEDLEIRETLLREYNPISLIAENPLLSTSFVPTILTHNFKYFIWDERWGKLASYGKIEIKNVYDLSTFPGDVWYNAIDDLVSSILKGTIFLKKG